MSIAAGLPSWGALLKKLAKKTGITSEQDLEDMSKLNFLDQARLVSQRMGGQEKLSQAIASELTCDVYSIVHALLAALPIESTVTTNYDTLFEMASRVTQGKVSVLPYDQNKGKR